jgi:hypothetical protein
MSTQQNIPMFQAQRRPCGVIFMGVFLFIQGIFLIIGGFLRLAGIIVLLFDVSKGGALLLHGLVSGVLGIVSIIISIGLFMLRPWAFWGIVLAAVLNLINSLIILVQTSFASWGQIFVALLSLVILLYFLTRTNVRAAFHT